MGNWLPLNRRYCIAWLIRWQSAKIDVNYAILAKRHAAVVWSLSRMVWTTRPYDLRPCDDFLISGLIFAI